MLFTNYLDLHAFFRFAFIVLISIKLICFYLHINVTTQRRDQNQTSQSDTLQSRYHRQPAERGFN